jgi:hypothetical protein
MGDRLCRLPALFLLCAVFYSEAYEEIAHIARRDAFQGGGPCGFPPLPLRRGLPLETAHFQFPRFLCGQDGVKDTSAGSLL